VLGGTAQQVSKAAPCLVVLVSPQAGGKQSRAESLTLAGRCGGRIQACQYTSPTVLHGFSLLGGLAGYLDVHRRPATCGVSKNLRERGQVDADSSNGLFDTQAGPV